MLRLRAPAKLNLYLRVLGRRPDGYHDIETLFERIDLSDELAFEPAADLALTCSDPALSCGEDNLILKAARLLQQGSGATQARPGSRNGRAGGARIHLTKRIPIAAGLGGGSSDAAAALRGLNQLWNLGLGPAQLFALGAVLGADVPFFLQEAPFAIGRGRGEACEPLDAPPLAHILVIPAERLSTKAVYDGWDLAAPEIRLTAQAPSITMVAHALCNGPDLSGLAEGLWNDLEPEAIRRCPVIATIQSCLRDSGCLGVRMSGSGPAVFGLCADTTQAQAVRARLPSAWRTALIQTDACGQMRRSRASVRQGGGE